MYLIGGIILTPMALLCISWIKKEVKKYRNEIRDSKK